MINMNVIITEHTVTIPLILAVQTLTKNNLTPSQWWGNSLQKVNHFDVQTWRLYVLQRRKAFTSSAWSLHTLSIQTSISDVTCILPLYHMPGKQKESIMCDLYLGSKMYYYCFTVSILKNYDQFFFFAFWNQVLAHFDWYTCYLHLTLMRPWAILKA